MNRHSSTRTVDISIIAPLYNEEENVRPLFDAVMKAMGDSHYSYEIILVDDGSTDGTAKIAGAMAEHDQRVRLIRLRRNCGQTPAMSAGIDYANARILVTIDGDLQNDPRDIPMMIDVIEKGADLVVGWRRDRKDNPLSRVLPSRIANWLISRVTGLDIKDSGCSLKAYRASMIKQIPLYSEMHRFIPVMASIAGAKVEQVVVHHHERRFGRSNYGIGRTWRVLLDLLSIKTIVAFAARPMLWFTAMALLPGLLAMTIGGIALLDFIENAAVSSIVPAGIALQCLALSVFLLACGVISELTFRSSRYKEHQFALLTAETLTSISPTRQDFELIRQAKKPGGQ